MSRYDRQSVLEGVGAQGQARLTGARVLVVGAGGLGNPVLQYLAGAGVGHITLMDGDCVEEGNLHRQPLFRMDQLGQPKVTAAASALRALNPAITIIPLYQWLDPANAPQLVAQADLVLDCADTFAASLVLSDCCLTAGVPLISASVLARSGYVGGFCAGAPSLRALFPDLPERAASCASAGVMGPLVGAIGALQAQMALGVLLEQHPSPLGQLLSLDVAGWRLGGFRFETAPEPSDPLPFIAQSQVRPDDLLFDLRDEVTTPFDPRARRRAALDGVQPPPGGRVVLACRSGLRADQAGRLLRNHWSGAVALLAILPELKKE